MTDVIAAPPQPNQTPTLIGLVAAGAAAYVFAQFQQERAAQARFRAQMSKDATGLSSARAKGLIDTAPKKKKKKKKKGSFFGKLFKAGKNLLLDEASSAAAAGSWPTGGMG